jgi:hypothetical protein
LGLLAGIIHAMTPAIMVRWVPAESWAEVANEAWHVLHDADRGVKQADFVRAYPDDGVAVAETAAGEIVGVLTLKVRPEGYNERFEAFQAFPGRVLSSTKSESPSQCAVREWVGC